MIAEQGTQKALALIPIHSGEVYNAQSEVFEYLCSEYPKLLRPPPTAYPPGWQLCLLLTNHVEDTEKCLKGVFTYSERNTGISFQQPIMRLLEKRATT